MFHFELFIIMSYVCGACSERGSCGPRVKSASSSKIYNFRRKRDGQLGNPLVCLLILFNRPTDRPEKLQSWDTSFVQSRQKENTSLRMFVSCCLPLQQSETKYHYSLFVSRGDYCALLPKTTFHSSSYRALFHLSSKLTN